MVINYLSLPHIYWELSPSGINWSHHFESFKVHCHTFHIMTWQPSITSAPPICHQRMRWAALWAWALAWEPSPEPRNVILSFDVGGVTHYTSQLCFLTDVIWYFVPHGILTPGSIFHHCILNPLMVNWPPHFYQNRGVHNTIREYMIYHGLWGRYTWVWGSKYH